MSSSYSRDAARALAFWLLSTVSLLAQEGLEVRSPSAKVLEAAPGRIVTVSVVVANRTGVREEIAERLALPPGCQKVAPPDLPFRLDSEARAVRVIAISVPANMPAGKFPVRYVAQDRRDPSWIGSLDFALQVALVDGLELVVEPRPDVVIAGDEYPIQLRVTNRGNSRIAVQLAAKSSLGFPVSSEADSFPLEAGASRVLTCKVKTDPKLPLHTSHAVTFDVSAASATGKPLQASQASVVEMIPRVSGSRDLFHHLPMQLRVIELAEKGSAPKVQAELSGAGSLDEAGTQQVDFLFRGPDIRSASLFGDRDEYGASYADDLWSVDLGDRIYALSPLTERHSMGRGAGIKWHDDNFSAGAFLMSTRFRQHNTTELGAFVREDFSGHFSLQGNFLRKSGGDVLSSHALPQNIVTVAPQFRLGKAMLLDLEAGVSRSDLGVTDFAYRAEARGELLGKLSYSLEETHAGRNFRGYFSGSDTTYATVTKVFSEKVRAHASFTHAEDNPSLLDERATVVNRETSWTLGASYALSPRTEFSLEWNHAQRADILLPAAYDFTEDFLRSGVGRNFGKLQLQSFLDLGTLDNALTGENGPFARVSEYLTWHPTARQTYSVYGAYGPSAYTGSRDRAVSAGVSATWQWRDHISANVSYARNQFDGLSGSDQDQVLGSVRYEFANKTVLTLLGRWSHATTKQVGAKLADESAAMLTYAIPLSIPVARKRSIGALEGRLHQVGGGAGIARAVVQIGEQFAVTDETGGFEFPSLKPGGCELKVVADSLGPRTTMVTPLPLKLKVRPAETTHVDLEAAPAGSILVHVLRFEFANGNAFAAHAPLREAGGFGGVNIEITNGREVWRAQTDRAGAASFERLAPGQWSLRVTAADLPSLHYLEAPARTLELKPGAEEKLDVRLLPQARTLRMLDKGTIR